ncbi:WG repeat-containing protein [Micromonospora peucetia]|uniref:WG repeat-containing protein n=1 Tax=Micromonospora peucetia TaxID=47871 RepID=UPI003F603726
MSAPAVSPVANSSTEPAGASWTGFNGEPPTGTSEPIPAAPTARPVSAPPTQSSSAPTARPASAPPAEPVSAPPAEPSSEPRSQALSALAAEPSPAPRTPPFSALAAEPVATPPVASASYALARATSGTAAPQSEAVSGPLIEPVSAPPAGTAPAPYTIPVAAPPTPDVSALAEHAVPAQPVSASPVPPPATQAASAPPTDVSERPGSTPSVVPPAATPPAAAPSTATPSVATPSVAAPLAGQVPPTDAERPTTPSTTGPSTAETSTAEPDTELPGGSRDVGRLSAAQGDPEQVLSSYRWRLDPATLREIVAEPDEFRTIRRRLTEKLGAAVDNKSRARLLSLRAVVSRILGELDDALADGRLALTYAEATGELRRTAVAQARLAHVLRWRGEFVEADRLFAEANCTELPERLRAVLHEHAGRSCYDQGRLMEACHHFERALDLRGTEDSELQARIRLSLDAVAERVAETGFGPYPRSREEVLEHDRPPVPARDGDLWGFSDPDGDMVIAAEYAQAQPFRDGLAWVRCPETERWSLVDRTGATVLEPSYPVVRPFSDGLAWVSDGDDAGWVAIDATGEVVVPHGFADVRPFRRGVAVVRRDGWGAVDRNGRIVVPTRHHGFPTVLADGRYVEGFTDEGLAVVDVAGRRGVVNRAGKVLVPPTHPALVIHPVAFLVGDGTGRWGALDRRGEPLIEPVHRDREEVVAEIERLLVDTSPVL